MRETYRAKLTGKGQVQVPKAVREALGAQRGDEIIFEVKEEGAVYVTCESRVNLMDLAGALRLPRSRYSHDEERDLARQRLASDTVRAKRQ